MGEGDSRYDRSSTLSVARGLHVFRYVNFSGSGVPAIGRLIAAEAAVSLLDMPGRDAGVLQQPGDCLVVRADRASDVVVGLRRGSPDGTLDATFRLEPIVLGEAAAEAPSLAPTPAGLSFVAHLSKRGDTAFAQDVWAGGPDAPAAVEGLSIVGDGSALELQVLVGSRPPRWPEWVGAGQYAGTRGHGLPLLGLRLRLKPESAGLQGFEIAAEALFLGALVASQRGRQVEFVSGSGVDPLIGVKIGVQRLQEASLSRPVWGQEASAREREPRVRVFRASAGR